ncbi:replication protein P [Paraburkholderia sediminicola]|uniref:replication protein P n=1 Tax=Paraburkholderia sediminicola TaxID=458836 RepID=UPI0038BABE00
MTAQISSSTFKRSSWHEIHQSLGISLLDHLYNRLDGIYPTRWKAQFPNERAIENWREAWAEAFEEERIDTRMVSDALRMCRKTHDWPPSLAEFLKACKPIINVDAALHEAVNQMHARQLCKDQWSDPAIFWAAVKVGEFDLLSLPFAALKPRFEAALTNVREGEVLPVPARVPALQAPGKSESTREYGRQRLNELSASNLIRKVSQGGNLAWAYRAIEEHERAGMVPQDKLNLARKAILSVTGREP